MDRYPGGDTAVRLVRAVDVDVAFALFLAVDWFWLWASARLAGVEGRGWRVGLAAALAAAAGVWAEFPGGMWLRSWPAKLAVSLLLVAAGYAGPRQGRSMGRLLAAFLGTGAAMAGVGLLLGGGRAEGLALVPVAPGVWAGYPGPARGATPLSLIGAGLAVAGGSALIGAGRAWRRLAAGLVPVEVAWGDAAVRMTALVDTGNQLREPLGGGPVIVASAAALADALPAAVGEAARAGPAGGPGAAGAALPQEWAARCRLVPYQSIGAAGWLLAVLPDRLTVAGRPVRAYIALAPAPVHPQGRFQALVPPALLTGNPRPQRAGGDGS